jgi:hypothetical protein
MSYTEVVRPVRAAQGGEFTSKNANVVTTQFLKALVNCTIENDHWETEPGARQLNPVPIEGEPTIVTVYHWEPTPGVRRLIACTQTGKILKSSDGGGSWDVLATGD